MIPQWIQIYKDEILSDSGSKTFPLKTLLSYQVLEMLLTVRAKNGATCNSPDASSLMTPEQGITKIEVSSGGEVFKSYSGEINRKFATYRNGRLPSPTLHTQIAGGTWAGNHNPSLGWMDYGFPINFNIAQDPYGNIAKSRGLGPAMLPAALYDALDLYLEWSFTASATAGVATGNEYFDLWALVLPKEDEATMKRDRILYEKKKDQFTTAASGDKNIDLTDNDDTKFLRQLLVQCYETPSGSAGIGEGIDINYIDFKQDNKTVWESTWGKLQEKNATDCRLNYEQAIFTKAQGTDDELWTRVPTARPLFTAQTTTSEDAYLTQSNEVITINAQTANDLGLLRIGSDVVPAVAIMDFDQDGSLQSMPWCGSKQLQAILTQGGADGSALIYEQLLGSFIPP